MSLPRVCEGIGCRSLYGPRPITSAQGCCGEARLKMSSSRFAEARPRTHQPMAMTCAD